MKTKFLLLLVMGILGSSALTANADPVDISSCQWVVAYSYVPHVVVSKLQCSGFSPVTKAVHNSGTTCTLSATQGYTVTGTCAQFSVNTIVPKTACELSSYAGKYQGSSPMSSDMAQAAQIASADCQKGSCGLDVFVVAGKYELYCKKQ